MGYMGRQPSIYHTSKMVSNQLLSGTVILPEEIWSTSNGINQWKMFDQTNVDSDDCWISDINNNMSGEPEIALRVNTSSGPIRRITMNTRNILDPIHIMTPVDFDIVYTEDVIPGVYDATTLRGLTYTVVQSFVGVTYSGNSFINFESFVPEIPSGAKWGIRVTEASGSNNQVAIGTFDGYFYKIIENGEYSMVPTLNVGVSTTIDEFNDIFKYDTQSNKVPTQKAIVNMVDTKYKMENYTIQYFSSPILECQTLTGTNTPYFIRVNQLTNGITVLATQNNPLSLEIEKKVYELTEDKSLGNLTLQTLGAEFTSNDVSLDGSESTTYLTEFFITSATGQCSNYNRRTIAFRSKLNPDKIMIGILELDTNKITNLKTRYWFDYQDQPINPIPLTNGDVFEIIELNWIFMDVDKNLTFKTEPIYMEYDRPVVVNDGDIWFNSELGKWEEYNTVGGWINFRSELIGYVAVDDTLCVGSRCFDKRYIINNIDQTTFVTDSEHGVGVKTEFPNVNLSVYNKFLTINPGKVSWWVASYSETPPFGSLENGLLATFNTWYYMYIGTNFETYLSSILPNQAEVSGQSLHPFNDWRCIGRCYYANPGTITSIEKI